MHGPYTRNTQHSTLNTQHSTLNTQHSTLNTQHSTLRAVEVHGDLVGARAVEMCGLVVDQMARPSEGDATEDETAVESRNVVFPLLLADVIRRRLAAFAGAGALLQALDLCSQMLRGAAGPAALAALALASSLLCAPFAPPAGAPPVQPGTPPASENAFGAVVTEVLVTRGGGQALVAELFGGARGRMPPSHVSDIASTLHFFCCAAPPDVARAWLLFAAGGPPNLTVGPIRDFHLFPKVFCTRL